MKPFDAFFISSLLAVGLGWFGLGFVEAAAIFVGAVIVVFAAERADDAAFAGRPSAGWICAIVLGASVAIAGAFDLFNVGRDTELGDWDAGFIFGLAILGPIGLLHIWINRRSGKAQDREDAGLGALVLGAVVTELAFTLLADPRSMAERVGNAGIVATVGFVASMFAQVRVRGAPPPSRQLGDLAAAALIATGFRLPFDSFLLSITLFGAAWGSAMLGVSYSRFGRAAGLTLGVFKQGAVTGMLSAAILWVLMLGSLAPRGDWSVSEAVAALEDLVPLPQPVFARLVMSDYYLWAHAPVREGNNAGRDAGDFVEALRHPADRWSGTLSAYASKAQLSGEYNDGLDFVEEGGIAVVAHVHPESWAAKAGVKRGWRLDTPGRGLARRTRIPFTDPDGKRHDVERRDRVGTVPESWWRVVEQPGRKVAYLYLSGFHPPSRDQLSSSFAALKRAGVEDLVLDLRYNPGGSLGIALHLARLIAGPEQEGKIFQRTIHNERYGDNDRTARFKRHAEALGLKRVFVLTTKDTCSASESVITGLAPHINVVTVGTTTCGKPVGFTPLDYWGISYWVINFKLRNAAGQGDYFSGLAPTCEVKEDLRHTLGSPDEALFAEALHYMSTGRCSKS